MEKVKSTNEKFEKNSKSYNSIFSFGIDFVHEFFKYNKNFVPKNISEKIFSFINKNQKLKEFAIWPINSAILIISVIHAFWQLHASFNDKQDR